MDDGSKPVLAYVDGKFIPMLESEAKAMGLPEVTSKRRLAAMEVVHAELGVSAQDWRRKDRNRRKRLRRERRA